MSALIQMTLQTAEPNERLTEISDLIYEIKGNMEQHNEAENAKCQEKSDYCTITINSMTKDLQEKKDKLEQARKDQQELRVIKGETEKSLVSERENFDQSTADLAETQGQLDQENAEYEKKNNEYTDLILACEEGINLLRKMTHGQESSTLVGSRQSANFIQLAQLKNKLATSGAKIQKTKNRKSALGMLSPVVAVLVAIQNKAQMNWDDLMNVINLLEDILARLKGEQTQLFNRHNQVVKDLTNIIDNLNEQIANSISLIEIYESRLADTVAQLLELANLIADTEDYVNSLSIQLTDMTNECQEAAAKCSEEASQRAQELAILDELIAYFESQVRTSVEAINL